MGSNQLFSSKHLFYFSNQKASRMSFFPVSHSHTRNSSIVTNQNQDFCSCCCIDGRVWTFFTELFNPCNSTTRVITSIFTNVCLQTPSSNQSLSSFSDQVNGKYKHVPNRDTPYHLALDAFELAPLISKKVTIISNQPSGSDSISNTNRSEQQEFDDDDWVRL